MGVSAACAAWFALGGIAAADPTGHADGVEAGVTTPVTTVVVPPTPLVVLPPGGDFTQLSANAPGALSTGVLSVSSHRTSSTGSASSASVVGANVLTGAVTAGVLQSSCAADIGGSTGSGSLANAQAGGTPLAANPAPNTVVPVPLLGTITLNEQQTTSSGIIVRALHARIATPLGTLADVIISESACFSGAEAPAASAGSSVAGRSGVGGATRANPNLTG